MPNGRNIYILGIDPANVQTAYVLLGPGLRPFYFDKVENEQAYTDMMDAIEAAFRKDAHELRVAIEGIESFGLPVGKTTIETCYWIGQLLERFKIYSPVLIYRHQEKMNLCHSMKAKDGNIRQALVDRFAPGDENFGKGTKNNPGFFYGFRADIWQAMAVATTYHDLYITQEE